MTQEVKEKAVLLSLEQRKALELLLWRKENEPIRFFKPNQGAQKDFFDLLKVKREVAYFAGNKSGKTYCGAKYVVQAALGLEAAKYSLPVLYENKVDVWVGSVDYKTQREASQLCIEELLPAAEIQKVYYIQNGIIDRIVLKNGSTIGFKTYDQGRKAWQGPVKTIIWFDEEPPEEVMKEGLARLTAPNAKAIFTLTPLLGITNVYHRFVEDSRPYRGHVFGSTYENKDHLTDEYLQTLEDMSEADKQQRIYGKFVRLEGLVYEEFRREHNVIPHFWPDKARNIFLGGMDFGADHPTAFVIAAIDVYGNIFVFDEYKEADAQFEEHAMGWKGMRRDYLISAVYRDPSAKQAGIEFSRMKDKSLRIQTRPGVNDRATGISLINNLFYKKKLFISDRCVKLIYELEHHRYKSKKQLGKDGDVIKLDDDLSDALRYLISSAMKAKLKIKKVEAVKSRVARSGINW